MTTKKIVNNFDFTSNNMGIKKSFWSNEDPRAYFSNANRYGGDIIIARPNNDWGGTTYKYIGEGDVYAEYGWDIFTTFEDYKHIDVDTEWNEDWWWTEMIDLRYDTNRR